MADEDHAVEIVSLPLKPVGAGKHVDDRGHLRGLVGFGTQANARIQRRRQQMIDHVEPFLAAGIVDRRHVGQVDEAAGWVVAEIADDIDDSRHVHIHRQLVEGHGVAGRRTGKRANDRLPQSVKPAVVHDPKTLAFDGSGAPDFLLQEQNAVKQRLRRGRTTGHVDVDGHDAVAAAHHRVGIVIITAAVGA